MFNGRWSGILISILPAVVCQAQVSKVPTPPIRTQPPIVAAGDTLDFKSVVVNQISFSSYQVMLQSGEYFASGPLPFPVTHNGDGTTSYEFKGQVDASCRKPAPANGKLCVIVIGFSPSAAQDFEENAYLKVIAGAAERNVATLTLKGTGVSAPSNSTGPCPFPRKFFLPTMRLTMLPPGVDFGDSSEELAEQVAKDFGNPYGRSILAARREGEINCYFSTNNSLAFFTQFKSIYNGASSASTVIANIGSYNFSNGMQMSLGTNIQAGPTASQTSTSVNGLPTLAATNAAQAAQNLFYGGNIYLYDLVPLLSKSDSDSSRWLFTAGLLGREGVDVQNFSGKSTTATNPNSHFNSLLESYWQYNATPPAGSQTSPLAIFLGAQYGYGYTSHGYARSYGFADHINAQLGDVSAGVLVNSAFNIAISREFGPSQTYIDSSSGSKVSVNNFKTWSFAIQYQTKGLGTSQ